MAQDTLKDGINKFIRFGNKIDSVLKNELIKSAYRIRNNMIKSIARGTKTGKVYTWRGLNPGEQPDGMLKSSLGHLFPVKKRSKPHRASAPGQSPATDTGELINSIVVDVRRNEIEVGSGPGAPYAEWLEFGTKAMNARPFLFPAFDDESDKIENNIIKSIINHARVL